MLNRLKAKVFYCYRLQPQDEGYQEGLQTFFPPVTRFLNLRPVTGESILATGGELSKMRMIGKIQGSNPDQYYENDLLFVNREPAPDFDPIDPGADFRVVYAPENERIREVVIERII